MKEYIAEAGGRYTYVEDLLNLQELALSISSIFDGCASFIIAGCEVSGAEISPGFVWINNKIRYFEGCSDAVYPYFIYEKNNNDSSVYANDVNKRGRCNYLCAGGKTVPDKPDAVTNSLPGFIEIKPDYAPRSRDKFFGRYAVLLDTPFARQTIKKDIAFTGNVSVEKDVESKTSLSVLNPLNGYSIKNTVKAGGNASVGTYLNGLPVNEIIINTDGSFSFYKQDKELARVSEDGFTYTHSSANTSRIGSVLIYDSNIINSASNADDGAVNINYTGYLKGGTKYRNFNVYNGKQANIPIFRVEGKTDSVIVNGALHLRSQGKGVDLCNATFAKNDVKLQNLINWTDKANESAAYIGYATNNTFDFDIKNDIGNIIITPKSFLDIIGELRINGVPIGSTYVTKQNFTNELNKKVSSVAGKQLSTEDFTTAYKAKLDSISKGSLTVSGDGYVVSRDVIEALNKKLNAAENLSDIPDKATARINLNVYSKTESNSAFLKVSHNLLELISLSADEINGLSPEQASDLKAQKQTAVRDNLNAEKKGTGDLKLAKASNLSDLPDKAQARKNISVYSAAEVDKLLEGKLSTDGAYTGAVFTTDLKKKLEDIKTGGFAGTDNEGKPINQTEGYALVSHIVKEFGKKANLLMDGYNTAQKDTIATNLDIYRKGQADLKFASVSSIFQDYITELVRQGKSSAEAQKILRDKLNTPSKEDLSTNYLRKDGKLSDLVLANADAKKLVCRTLGAAYADEYQTKLKDTGWIQMSNSGGSTDTRRLFIRQIGNIVCIQGIINTGKRDGGNWGGTIAIIPNQVEPPKYGLQTSAQVFNNDHKYNRGTTFVLRGNTRNIVLYESGHNNVDTEINFTYMT